MADCSSENDEIVEICGELISKKYTVGKEIIENGKKLWLPVVEENCKPFKGKYFDNLHEAYIFYEEYAKKGGFEARLGTQKPTKNQLAVKLKYFVCSREGFKRPKVVSSNSKEVIEITETTEQCDSEIEIAGVLASSEIKQIRNRASQRCGCEASVRLRFTNDGKYFLYHFEEKHNHNLVLPEHMVHLKSQRKLSAYNKGMIQKMVDASLGPVIAYRVLTKIHGGHENVGATAVLQELSS